MSPPPDSPAPATGAAPAPLPELAGRTILQAIPELDAGGAERTVLEITEALREAGARSLVATRGGRMARDLEALGGEVVRIDARSKNPLTLRANSRRLAALVAARGIDLIHARSRAPAWSALWAARKAGAAFVTTYHGAYSGGNRAKILYNSVMARGDRVIANSDWMAAHVRAVHGLGEDRLVTIKRGVDLMSFDPDTIPPERARDQRAAWGLHPDDRRLVLLLPGRLTDWKGQRLAVSALARMSDEERAERVLVCMGDAQGRADYVEALQRDVAEAGLTGAVIIAPHSPDMPAALLAADIVISASIRPEAFGRIVAEGSAMGRPVIAPDHGGAREIVLDGETGTRFAPGDPHALAGAIRTLVALGERGRKALGETGRAHIAANYSKRGLQAATLGVYSQLLGAR
ncbi:MAG: glycosyltransferase [Alphaproteobacteria bacterium]|nr:glycosyltransferase [Alphaproteobacteria bacterium]